jgi:hypothetical protein
MNRNGFKVSIKKKLKKKKFIKKNKKNLIETLKNVSIKNKK